MIKIILYVLLYSVLFMFSKCLFSYIKMKIRMRKEENRLKKFIKSQKELDPEFNKILHDNLWELYEE